MESGTWGDNLMVFAANHVYGTGIMVVSSLGEGATQFIHRTGTELSTDESARDIVLLGHLAESHYISLKPLQKQDQQPSMSDGNNSHIEFTAEPVKTGTGSTEASPTQTTCTNNDGDRSDNNIELLEIAEDIRNSIIAETSGYDGNNTINHFRDVRQEGIIPVCCDNARVVMFLSYIKSKGCEYRQFNCAYGSFVCLPERDMATFDDKSLYLEAGISYRLDSKPIRFWLSNICPNDRRGNITCNDHGVVEMPEDIAKWYDTWYDQLKLSISLELNQ